MSWIFLNNTDKTTYSSTKITAMKKPMDYWFFNSECDLSEEEKLFSFLKDIELFRYNLYDLKTNNMIYYEFQTSDKELATLFRLTFC